MASLSDIDGTDMTWNPALGCVKMSQGCTHCLAGLAGNSDVRLLLIE